MYLRITLIRPEQRPPSNMYSRNALSSILAEARNKLEELARLGERGVCSVYGYMDEKL